MERVALDGVEIEYEVTGAGEPVLLIHGSVIAEGGKPLMSALALADRYQVIRYHRRGYLGSSLPGGPVSMARQAADARALLQHLGVDKAHIVGHSYGGSVITGLPDL